MGKTSSVCVTVFPVAFVVVVAVLVVVVVAAVVVVVVVSCRKVSALMNNFPIGWTSTGNQSRRKERRRKEAKGKGAKRKCHNHGFRGKEGVREGKKEQKEKAITRISEERKV